MNNRKKVRLLQIGHTSEWALAKFFPALFNGVYGLFNLIGICGKEADTYAAKKRLEDEIQKRKEYLSKGETWRSTNTQAEIDSLENILDYICSKKIDYYKVINEGRGIKMPNAKYDAAAIFTKNNTHLDYIEALIRQKKHILCEKPLVVVTDKNHRADRTQLDRLEKIVEQTDSSLILMDAEHYSAKIATLVFYDNIQEMVKKYGKISKIEACSKEKDDPDKERTRKTLSKKNKTGLLLDMGVHYFGIISNIDGSVPEIEKTKYDVYLGENSEAYDVETFVNTKFKIRGDKFHKNASGEFTFVKFIDKLKEKETEDKKEFKITFKKEEESTVVTIDFRKNQVTDNKGMTWTSKKDYSPNEYVNILKEFYEAIENGIQPRTSFKRSIKTLEVIYRIYEKFPVFNEKNQINKETQLKVYKREFKPYFLPLSSIKTDVSLLRV